LVREKAHCGQCQCGHGFHRIHSKRQIILLVKDFAKLARRLGHDFKQPDLLRQALTHRSFGQPHNERLEFLGDSVLNCVVAKELYQRFPRLPEGTLSRLRANLVNQQSLAEVALSIDLGEYLLLGEGELKSGGFRRPSILADALEASFGAIQQDCGFDAADKVIASLLASRLEGIDPKVEGKDPKTLLQEYLQGRKIALPQYAVVSISGEAHEQYFKVECSIPDLAIRTVGEGISRRGAEQEAAQQAHQLAMESK
jgi:ribonuclease-3